MTGYITGTGNELTASPGTTYTYDNEGNMTAQANTSTHVVTSYTYDYHNRLIGVTVEGTAVATYNYDALDRRIGINDNGTQTWVVWDGQNPYADFNGSTVLQQRYLYGPAVDEILARTSSGGTIAWYLTDRLGTVRDIVSTSGTALDHIVYDSFGNVKSESNSANGDRFKFTGRELDGVTGLQDNRARVYFAVIGRFVQQDPTVFAAGDVNLYRSVGNNSTNQIDPTGEQSQNEQNQKVQEMNQLLQKALQEALKTADAQSKVSIQKTIDVLKNTNIVFINKLMKDEKGALIRASTIYRGNKPLRIELYKGWDGAYKGKRGGEITILHETYHISTDYRDPNTPGDDPLNEASNFAWEMMLKYIARTKAYKDKYPFGW